MAYHELNTLSQFVLALVGGAFVIGFLIGLAFGSAGRAGRDEKEREK